MRLETHGTLLRVYISEDEKYDGKPLYEQIVRRARELKLAGATVLRGMMGFGSQSHLHSAKILRLSEDLPVVIEIVDTAEHLETLLPFLEETVGPGLITMEDVQIFKYHPPDNRENEFA